MGYLLDILKWSAVVGAAALVLTWLKPALDKRYSPRWRYRVWPVLGALLLLAPVQWEALLPTMEAVEPPVVLEVPQAVMHISREAGVSVVPSNPASPHEERTAPVAGSAGRESAARVENTAAAQGLAVPVEAVLTALWLAGMGLFLLYHLVGTLWFRRRAMRWSQGADEETAAAYDGVCREMELNRRPRLRVSRAADSPMVLGLLRPCLLLPGDSYDARELRFILRHELTHYRRHDLWYQLLLLLANAVHWFNPLVYLLRREAGADMELTCDEAVVAGTDTETRRAYSETLLASIHRQKGLSRAVLSTHFYGGAKVMKERFRNILGRPGRKGGVLALVLALVLTVAAACSVALKETEGSDPAEQDGQPLTEEELALWQEKLSSVELNGFVTRLYTDVRYLPLGELFYNYQDVQADGSILTHVPGNADDIYEAAFGFRPDCGYTGITRTLAEEFLREYTGYTVEDFRGGFGSEWLYNEGSDSWFFAHGDTNYCFVNVLSGTKSGDTVTLELELPGGSASGGAASGTMTIVDGKFRSFTNELYTAVEAIAWDYVNRAAQSLETNSWIVSGEGETAPEGPKIVDSYISGLWSFSDYEIGDKTYSGWTLEYRLKPDDISKVVLAGGMSEANGWVTETSSVGSPVIIVSVDKDGSAALEEVSYDSVRWEMGYTWEEYITCHIHLGMDIGSRLDGFPDLSFLIDLLQGHNTWAADWQDVALHYLNQAGQFPSTQDLTLVQEFEIATGDDCDQSLLVEAKCGEETVTLFMSHILYSVESWDSTASFWMVNGALWPDGAGGSPDGEGGELLYTAGFQGERPGTARLYGARDVDRCHVSQVEVAWSDGGETTLDVADAVRDQWGDSTEGSTECWDETGGLLLEDFNFDGYTDIALQGWITASNLPRYLWLYDPQTGSFRYALCLNGELELDSMLATVTATSVDQGGAVRYQEHYRPDEAGLLYLTRRDTLRYENGEYILSSSETYDREGNLTATGEALLHETDFTLTEGKAGTLRLYGQKGESSGCGVSRAELTWDGDSGGTAFYTREAIVDRWGEDSVSYYTLAGSEDGGLRMEDVNFDGYTDICLQVDCSAAYNWSGAWWLYDPETGTFRYAFSLGWDVTIDREAQQLTDEFNGGSVDAHYRYTYAYRPDGSLFLTHRERFDLTTGEILEAYDGLEASGESYAQRGLR